MYYIQLKSNFGLETVDEYTTRKEAKEMLKEYQQLSAQNKLLKEYQQLSGGQYYLSSRACRAWTYEQQMLQEPYQS